MSIEFPSSSPASQIDKIANVSGDVIGVGVDGSGNIIGKNISIVINEAQRYGLSLLPANYFSEHRSTKQDFEDWKKGFSFKLESIKDKLEFRRGVVDDIKNKLENQHILLLLGESGSSKSTILMEIMCDYFDKGYKILYTHGESKITSGPELVKFIEGLVKADNKVLVAVDNAHDERAAAIFYVIDKLSNYDLQKNIQFLLTARLPEYDWFVKDRLGKIQEDEYSDSIKKFRDNSILKYELPYFSKDEVRDFMRKYGTGKTIFTEETLAYKSEAIYNDTNGHPIMVKFSVLGEGLRKDVESRYGHYLYDRINDQPHPIKIQTMLVCCLLDIANLPITDKFLEGVGLLEYAYDLDHATLYQYSEESWKTIHPRWDAELISFLYNESNKSILSRRKEYLKKTIDCIFGIKDQKITASIIQIMYDLASVKSLPINIVESIVVQLPYYLHEKTKCNLYVFAMAAAYRRLETPNGILENCNKALEINPNHVSALNNKGFALYILGKSEQAIEYYDKALEIDPNDVAALHGKGVALGELGRYKEAKEYSIKAVEVGSSNAEAWGNKYWSFEQLTDKCRRLDPESAHIWIRKGFSYVLSTKYQQGIECYDKALEIDASNHNAWNNKGVALADLGNYKEAIECYDKAIEIDPNDALAWSNKGVILCDELGKPEEAIELYNKAIELNPNDSFAWNNKGVALEKLGKLKEAIECNDKALEIAPQHADALNNKAWIYANTDRNKEALPIVEKSLEVYPNNPYALDTKGFILYNLGKYEEAIECYDKALEINPQHAGARYNRALSKVKKGDIQNGLLDLKKVIEIDREKYINIAKEDNGFKEIRDHEKFKALITDHTENK